jgi:hypothetical protein
MHAHIYVDRSNLLQCQPLNAVLGFTSGRRNVGLRNVKPIHAIQDVPHLGLVYVGVCLAQAHAYLVIKCMHTS